MSLWTKRLSEATYADLDAFCQVQYAEGIQLDYKRAIPSDLTKTVAAFANTRGGLLIIGVEANQTTNKPTWPSGGMPRANGLSEQIMQSCRDGIYPPILPEISSIIENPDDQTRVYVVVRVIESATAPHSIKNGTRVYVRTGDANHPIELSHIDRIAQLLARRDKLDDARERLLTRNLERNERYLNPGEPYCWWSGIPEYPDQEICPLRDCNYGCWGGASRPAPDGYFSHHVVRRPNPSDVVNSSCGRRGDVFCARAFRDGERAPLPGQSIAGLTLQFLRHCADFYGRRVSTYPGLLRISVGFRNVADLTMTWGRSDGHCQFPDTSLRIDRSVMLEQLLVTDQCNALAYDIVTEVCHSFNSTTPTPVAMWPT